MTDEDLRDRLAAWARPIESAQVPAIEIIAGRARRRLRRLFAAWAAAIAVACVVVAVVLPGLSSGGHGGGPASQATGWEPAGPAPGPGAGPAKAPFFVMLDLQSDPAPAVVYRVSRAQPVPRRIAAVAAPRGVTLTDVTAAADDRTFLLTGNYFRHRTLLTRYYELKLNAAGRPGRLIPLRIRLPARPSGGLGVAALSPDGSRLAVVGQTRHGLMVGVVSLATGAVRIWSAPGPTTRAVMLSWEGARTLAMLWTPRGRGGPQVRVLDTNSAGGSLLRQSRLLIPGAVSFGRFTRLAIAPITATSRAVFAVMLAPGHPWPRPPVQFALVRFSARSGRPSGVISNTAQQSGMGSFCGVLWADRSGRQIVTSCGYNFGSTRAGHYTRWSDHSFWDSLKYVPFAW